MHRCLCIQEMICDIFAECARSNLVALAATCKTFRDPALQIIWSHLANISPLIRCLPDDIWMEEDILLNEDPYDNWSWGPPGVRTKLILRRSPDQKTDWSRFKFYASFIRTLKCPLESFSGCGVDVDLFRALAESNLERPIIPKLDRLIWGRNDAYLSIFLGPQLRALTIWYPPPHNAIHDAHAHALGSLRCSSPHLESISLWGRDVFTPERPDLTPGVSDLICGLQGLKHISTDIQINHEAVRYLATSSCATLDIENDAANLLPLITGSGPPYPFPDLQSLSVTSHDLASFISLIQLLHAEKIHELVIHTSARPKPEAMSDIGQLTCIIEARCSHTELTRLVIDKIQTLVLGIGTPWTTCSFSALAPLLKFKNMTNVDILSYFAFDLDDRDIKELAIAWPGLQEFRLISAPRGPFVRSRVTLASIATLAKRCPALSTFGLVIHVAAVDFTLLPPEGTFTANEKIKDLELEHSTFDQWVNPEEIANFLSRLFPNLTRAYGNWVPPDTPWDIVSRHLLAYTPFP